MIWNSNKDFSDVVSVGEMIKARVKQGKIKSVEAKKSIPKRKEGETHVVSYQERAYNPSYPSQQNYGYQSYNQYGGNVVQGNYQSNYELVVRFPTLPSPAHVVTSQPIGQSSNNGGNVREARPQQEKFKPDLIPMTYTELYPKLVQCGLLMSVDIPPLQPPYLRWYNEHVHYDYHSGNRGHSIKNCTALKRRVYDFIKKGELTFEDEDVPNVNGNPLPNHGGPKVNVVESSQEMQVKRDVRDVYMPMGLVYEALVKAGRLKGRQGKEKEIKD